MTQVDILNLIPAIYDAAFDPALWQTVLGRCASLLDSHCATLLYSQSALAGDMRLEGAGDGAIVHGFDASAIDDYLAHFAETNMFAARAIEVREGTIESDEDVMPRADFERTQFYNDFLVRRLGARSVLTTLLIRNRDRLVAMTLCRGTAATAGYLPRDRRLLAQLVPHLKRAHEVGERLHQHEARGKRLEELLDRAAHGVLVVTIGGRVLYANRAAERMLRQGDALAASPSGLRAATPAVSDRLRALVAQAALGFGGGALALPSRTGPETVNALTAPCVPDRPWSIASDPCALVLLRTEGARARLLPEHARALFGLSRAEAQVAALLYQGLALTAIAEALEISRHTARVHLNAILAKTGVHRQSMLMQRLDAVAELYGASRGGV